MDGGSPEEDIDIQPTEDNPQDLKDVLAQLPSVERYGAEFDRVLQERNGNLEEVASDSLMSLFELVKEKGKSMNRRSTPYLIELRNMEYPPGAFENDEHP